MMLNCGFTQIDIAELGKSNIDLKSEVITHKRFKTEEHGNVPTVVFRLWPETLQLLREHLNKQYEVTNRHGDVLALVTRDGEQLLVKSYDEKGKLKKKDAIRSAYNRVVSKLERRGISVSGTLKHFRKTASSKLEEHENYGRYVVHFLGQSPETVAGKHYVTPSQKQFDLALAWLREQFGVASIL
jgi:integrase